MTLFHVINFVLGIAAFIFLALLAFAIIAFMIRMLLYLGMGLAAIGYAIYRVIRFIFLIPVRIVQGIARLFRKRNAVNPARA